MKDNFSKQAKDYSKFRPTYPDEMTQHILSFVDDRQVALDVATGNGQLAGQLAAFFKTVYATDISERQLSNAVVKPNIQYSLQRAEETSFADNLFDLITVAQAVHWFDFDAFYQEVYRILKPTGILAVLGYGFFKTNPESDIILNRYYTDITGPYWDPERRYLDEGYRTIPFPFEEFGSANFSYRAAWTFGQLEGYLSTWSAAQHYIEKNHSDPFAIIRDDLRRSWESGNKQVIFPMFLRMGRKKISR